jgi:hypothetical protein
MNGILILPAENVFFGVLISTSDGALGSWLCF